MKTSVYKLKTKDGKTVGTFRIRADEPIKMFGGRPLNSLTDSEKRQLFLSKLDPKNPDRNPDGPTIMAVYEYAKTSIKRDIRETEGRDRGTKANQEKSAKWKAYVEKEFQQERFAGKTDKEIALTLRQEMCQKNKREPTNNEQVKEPPPFPRVPSWRSILDHIESIPKWRSIIDHNESTPKLLDHIESIPKK